MEIPEFFNYPEGLAAVIDNDELDIRKLYKFDTIGNLLATRRVISERIKLPSLTKANVNAILHKQKPFEEFREEDIFESDSSTDTEEDETEEETFSEDEKLDETKKKELEEEEFKEEERKDKLRDEEGESKKLFVPSKDVKWWIWLTRNPEKYFVKEEEEEEELEEEPLIEKIEVENKVEKEKKFTKEMVKERRKLMRRRREDKKLYNCMMFWENLEKERNRLSRRVFEMQDKLQTWMEKKMKQRKEKEEGELMNKNDEFEMLIPQICINLAYLVRKRKVFTSMIQNELKNIIGARNKEVEILNNKLKDVKSLIKSENGWEIEYLPLITLLSKEVHNVSKNREKIRETLVDYYIDGVYYMANLSNEVIEQIKKAKIQQPDLYNKACKIIIETKNFIGKQILIFNCLKNMLLEVEWTYQYYTRIRIIRKLELYMKKLKSIGFSEKHNRSTTQFPVKKKIRKEKPRFIIPGREIEVDMCGVPTLEDLINNGKGNPYSSTSSEYSN